ncbi:MAG: tyrosine-type recombinase/integrase [Planctomycetaceae bacterium]|nr:tyrosine-type recombinase/integrase [Planctomycetaceae bacterium]
MTDTNVLSPWIRRFLIEHLVVERNLAHNTQKSYRDTLRLLLPVIARRARRRIDLLRVEDLSADRIRTFLQDLEETGGCAVATRNQRLSAIHSLARFISIHSPEHLQWSGEIHNIMSKKAARPLVTYLEKDEMDALLASPDCSTSQGRRDHAVLLFLYNTGARADEAAHVQITDLDVGMTPDRDPSSVLIRGKGNKQRRCPLWKRTVAEIRHLMADRDLSEHLFLNRRGQPLTRYGIHSLVERHAARVAKNLPSIAKKRVSPHTIRHTTATHLLRAGVDINTIRAWLGHVCLSTTNIYAEVDLEMKAKALANCKINDEKPQKHWRDDKGLMAFLKTL